MDAIEGTASTELRAAEKRQTGAGLLGLATASLGVVYGDIGTSPLYTIREIFGGPYPIPVIPANVLGALSLVVWSLLLVVSLKYVALMLRADNHGEGGVLALMALAGRGAPLKVRGRWLLMALGLFGAALFYGDGMITPAISVLSAVEGLKVGMPGLEAFVVPITVAVLIALFLVQRHGTAGIAWFFSPIVGLWFTALALLGIGGILREPQILHAFNPIHGVSFLLEHRLYGFLALGAVFLAVTGSEALYADMGHFGKRPIRLAWFGFVLPALLLNYLGQGALLIAEPAAAVNPFYLLAPAWALFPMVGLATAATVIASQAVISGAFSLTRQAIQLGYCPRMRVMHTSTQTAGQVYLPAINWTLLVGTVGLVLGFQSSSALASAYGIAVNGAMLIDTLLVLVVARGVWNWSWAGTLAAAACFLCIDLGFLGANSLKLLEGGWFPLLVAIGGYTLLSTWKRGRQLLSERLRDEAIALESLLFGFSEHPPLRVPGTAVFMTSSREGVPHALLHNLAHNKVLHERVVFLTVLTLDVPWSSAQGRLAVRPLANNFYRITVRYGFKDDPDIPAALAQCRTLGLEFNLLDTSFFLSRETMIPTLKRGMAKWRERLFIRMSHHAVSAMEFFRLPTNRVVELGTQIEI